MSNQDFAYDAAVAVIEYLRTQYYDEYEGQEDRIAAIIRRHAIAKPEPLDYNERTGSWE